MLLFLSLCVYSLFELIEISILLMEHISYGGAAIYYRSTTILVKSMSIDFTSGVNLSKRHTYSHAFPFPRITKNPTDYDEVFLLLRLKLLRTYELTKEAFFLLFAFFDLLLLLAFLLFLYLF